MINSNIEKRQNRNSQFDNKLEEVNTEEQFYRNVPEVGALISVQGAPFIGNGYEFVQLANVDQIPKLDNGYQVSYDGHNTDVSHAQGLTVVEQIIGNDNAINQGSLSVYDGSLFYFKGQAVYTVTISFNALAASITAHANLFFGNSGIAYNQYATLINFAFQANVGHAYSATFQIIGDESTENDGLYLYIFPSTTGKLWNAKFTIQRNF
jgi:hypothetical protein